MALEKPSFKIFLSMILLNPIRAIAKCPRGLAPLARPGMSTVGFRFWSAIIIKA